MLSPISYNNQPTFGVNLKSRKLALSQKDFFIKIKGYQKNTLWADEIKRTTEEAVELIRRNWDPDWVLFNITEGVKVANQFPQDQCLRAHTGVLRTPRAGWEYGSDWDGCNIITPYNNNKYKCYEKRLDIIAETPLINPFYNIGLSTIRNDKQENVKEIRHPSPDFINNAFQHIDRIYGFIQSNFIKKEVKPENMSQVNDQIAELRWIMAHTMPWERGSDSISNVFMRALYKAMGVKAYPPAKGVSFDLEAFCTNLDDYKRNFPNFFEKAPEVIE